MNPLMLETTLSERDVAALHEWQEQQSRRVAELEVALDFERSEVARLMNLLIEAQANGNHLRRALEWLAGHDRTNKDCPPEPYNDEDPTPEFPQEKAPEGTVCWDVALECVRCWCRAALAATKEATPQDHEPRYTLEGRGQQWQQAIEEARG